MRKVVVVLWIALLMGTLVVTPEDTKATDVNWWAKSYGVSDEDEATSVAIAFNGDIIIGGVTESFGNGSGDFWILRLDSSGDVIWQKAYGGSNWDYATSVTVADNGDIIAVGYTYSFGTGESDFISKSDLWVLRLDSNGNIKWQKAYGGSDYDGAYAVATAKNGDIIVAGWTESFGAGGRDAWVLRLDSEGNVKWQKSYGGSGWDEAYSVAIAKNGDIVVAGVTTSFGAGGDDVWVLRLDAKGNVKWQKTYGKGQKDEAYAVTIAPNGDIIVAGDTWSFGTGNGDAWVLRLDSNGNIKWQKAYGGSYRDYAASIAVAEGGDVIVAGNYLLRLSSDGELKWAKYIGGRAIEILPDGTAVLAGGSFRVLRFNIDYVPTYSGWLGWRDINPKVHDTNAEVKDTSAMVKTSNAQIQETSAEVHDTDAAVKTLWVFTLNKATLKIHSKPFGAEVYINGTYRGKTPLTIKLEPGRYTVRVTEEGYEDYTTTVTLEAGETKEITVQLKKKPTTTSKSHTYSQTTSTPTSTHTPSSPPETTTTKSGGICGPALILGLAMIPLLRRRR